jgi:cell wall-associated NlpC family hydrolase
VELQYRLNVEGFDAGPADGDFGPRTRSAVTSYQASRGLEADGVVGPRTWQALTEGAAPVQQQPPMSGDLRQRILSIAEREVGTLESGDNGGAALKYANSFGRGAEAWCGDFVSWVNTQAGNPMNAPYVPSLQTQLQQEGKWKGQSNPQPGDIVIFDWEGKGEAWHVGLVKGVNADGSIQTIEGNTSQPGGPEDVWEKTRYMSTVLSFANL